MKKYTYLEGNKGAILFLNYVLNKFFFKLFSPHKIMMRIRQPAIKSRREESYSYTSLQSVHEPVWLSDMSAGA